MKQSLFIILCLALLVSCQSEDSKEEQANKMPTETARNPVDTMLLNRSAFEKELISNGKLEAFRQARLRFRVSEVLEKVYVKNGDKVQKGQVLASLNNDNLESALEKARLQLEKANIEFQDLLIGQGYDPKDTSRVPDQFLRIARVKSGLAEAQIELERALKDYENRKLYAPFTGVVANIEKNAYDPVGSNEDFCRLINDAQFQVRFSVMESELDEIAPGKELTVYPLSGGSYRGTIREINPVVDENGLVTVRGLVSNSDGKLMEGMNVNLHIRNKIPDQLVIPKSALVLRQNRQVVFTLEQDSVAIWNYVQSSHENSSSYAISEGLKEGDRVITRGNINLAHESIVYVEPEKN